MSKNSLWWQNGIIYQIYPRSFMDTTANGIGDLNGITNKLDYLADLGIDAIWLSPIFPSPDVDFGYDVADYVAIDPRFGTMADFNHLLKESHKRNIHVILDLVLNHTSDQHPWFKESRKSRDNPYHDWYIWKDPSPRGGPPNNWLSIFGGSGWEFDAQLGQYYYHMFCKGQPDLNWRHPEVREALLNVFKFWLERGVDGFRLDVFNMYFKHSELPDNPKKLIGLRPFDRQVHKYEVSQPEMYPLLNEIRKLLDSYGSTFVVGETFLSSPEHTASYCGQDKLHAAFNFELAKSPWKVKRFTRAIKNWEKALEGRAWPNYFLNNHDMTRSSSRYCQDEDDARAKVCAAMLLTLRGTPFMYYGEEIGMRDISLKHSQILDPVGKRYWPFNKGRDGCRAPMQWDDSVNAGFSSTAPWLPVHPDYILRNVSKQKSEPSSLLNFYKQLIHLRKEHPALNQGNLSVLDPQNKSILSYLRQTPGESILILLNFKQKQITYQFPKQIANQNWRVLFSEKRQAKELCQEQSILILSYETLLLVAD